MVSLSSVKNRQISSYVTIIWVILFLITYLFIVDLSALHQSVQTPSHSPDLVHAVVMIAGGYMATNPLVDLSIQSLRRVGAWEGRIYVLTDKVDCFNKPITKIVDTTTSSSSSSSTTDNTNKDTISLPSTASKYDVQVIHVPPDRMNTVMKIKTLKTQLFEFLPDDVSNVLYMDVDIVVSRKLTGFLNDLNEQLARHAADRKHSSSSSGGNDKDPHDSLDIRNTVSKRITITSDNAPDYAMFLDAGGHFAGSWVSGVEKWHTGVIWYRRGAGVACMNAWKNEIESGNHSSDQESLDAAEIKGECKYPMTLSFRHLLFAKDYLMMLFRGGQTFTHFTAAGRGDELDPFYKNIVIPQLRKSIRPRLKLDGLEGNKQC